MPKRMYEMENQSSTREAVKKKFGRKRLLVSKIIPHYPQNLEREYVRIINAYMKLLKSTVADYIPRIRKVLEKNGYNQDAKDSVLSHANGETSPDTVKFGHGVMQGNTPGVDVVLPKDGSAAAQFEGVVVAGITEHDLDGGTRNNPTKMLGILDWGKVWARVPTVLTVAYGDKAYLIISGDDAGKFTNDDEDTLDINAKFITAVDSGDIAAIKLYDAPRV